MVAAVVTSLRFLTWNLAMLERSDEAPLGWEPSDTEAAVRDAVLDLAPDVICYQELPGLVPFVETHTMLPATPESHSGNLAMLLTPEARSTVTAAFVVGDHAIVATFADELTIANVHLMSGRAGEERRREQFRRVVEASPTAALLIVGDTNMRVAETGRLDAVTGEQPPSPTWDGRRNRFRADAPQFTAYFTRWFASQEAATSDVVVHEQPVEVDGHRFHLSDHHALSGTVSVGQTDGR